jgi:hypothetical protein
MVLRFYVTGFESCQSVPSPRSSEPESSCVRTLWLQCFVQFGQCTFSLVLRVHWVLQSGTRWHST